MKVRLVTLIENTISAHRGIATEHGLSFYLETPTIKLMFDFGESGKVYDNMLRLNIPIEDIQCAVCSHAHYDHGGGFKYIVPVMNFNKLITGRGFWTPKYATDGYKYTYLGPAIQPDLLKSKGIQQQVCDDILQLSSDCWAIGNFNRSTTYETIPRRFVLESNPGQFDADLFADEICLVVETGSGLAVIVGCSHPGIINILNTVQEHFHRPIISVWGGAHLVKASEQRIRQTAQDLQKLGIKQLGLCHCSGEQLEQLADYLPTVECCHLRAGDTVFL